MTRLIHELWEYRELLWRLTWKDLAIRYKQTVLGVAWALFTPLTMMLIFSFVFTMVAPVSSEGIPYPIFAYTGLLPWTFFATSLTSATTSLTSNFSLIT
ncbi:MAG: ABC transporter permease, partial [candidate division NC10 bacterium]|nr:ABC transporter permease [candidate division NC10 bacterium]